jgi:hypothetical protein
MVGFIHKILCTQLKNRKNYTAATKTATFDPTTNLTAATKFIWTITNVRDLAGNKIATVTRSFTTA